MKDNSGSWQNIMYYDSIDNTYQREKMGESKRLKLVF